MATLGNLKKQCPDAASTTLQCAASIIDSLYPDTDPAEFQKVVAAFATIINENPISHPAFLQTIKEGVCDREHLLDVLGLPIGLANRVQHRKCFAGELIGERTISGTKYDDNALKCDDIAKLGDLHVHFSGLASRRILYRAYKYFLEMFDPNWLKENTYKETFQPKEMKDEGDISTLKVDRNVCILTTKKNESFVPYVNEKNVMEVKPVTFYLGKGGTMEEAMDRKSDKNASNAAFIPSALPFQAFLKHEDGKRNLRSKFQMLDAWTGTCKLCNAVTDKKTAHVKGPICFRSYADLDTHIETYHSNSNKRADVIDLGGCPNSFGDYFTKMFGARAIVTGTFSPWMHLKILDEYVMSCMASKCHYAEVSISVAALNPTLAEWLAKYCEDLQKGERKLVTDEILENAKMGYDQKKWGEKFPDLPGKFFLRFLVAVNRNTSNFRIKPEDQTLLKELSDNPEWIDKILDEDRDFDFKDSKLSEKLQKHRTAVCDKAHQMAQSFVQADKRNSELKDWVLAPEILKMASFIVGFDICAQESEYPWVPFCCKGFTKVLELLKDAHKSAVGVRLHLGELIFCEEADTYNFALNYFCLAVGVKTLRRMLSQGVPVRIGHGLAVAAFPFIVLEGLGHHHEDKSLLSAFDQALDLSKLLLDAACTECCLSSNAILARNVTTPLSEKWLLDNSKKFEKYLDSEMDKEKKDKEKKPRAPERNPLTRIRELTTLHQAEQTLRFNAGYEHLIDRLEQKHVLKYLINYKIPCCLATDNPYVFPELKPNLGITKTDEPRIFEMEDSIAESDHTSLENEYRLAWHCGLVEKLEEVRQLSVNSLKFGFESADVKLEVVKVVNNLYYKTEELKKFKFSEDEKDYDPTPAIKAFKEREVNKYTDVNMYFRGL